MACFIHKWNGCTCAKCGKVRNIGHDFQKAEGSCEQICSRCGASNGIKHHYVNGYCDHCGTRSEAPVDVEDLTDGEIGELIPLLSGYLYYCGAPEVDKKIITSGFLDFYHVYDFQYALLYKTYRTLGTFDSCRKIEDPGLFSKMTEAFTRMAHGTMTLKEAIVISTAARLGSRTLRDQSPNKYGSDRERQVFSMAELERNGFLKLEASAPTFKFREAYHQAVDRTKNGWTLDPIKQYSNIWKTIDLFESAAKKIEHGITGYREALARHGDRDDDEDFSLLAADS